MIFFPLQLRDHKSLHSHISPLQGGVTFRELPYKMHSQAGDKHKRYLSSTHQIIGYDDYDVGAGGAQGGGADDEEAEESEHGQLQTELRSPSTTLVIPSVGCQQARTVSNSLGSTLCIYFYLAYYSNMANSYKTVTSKHFLCYPQSKNKIYIYFFFEKTKQKKKKEQRQA